jgi:hypothetical protein
MMKGQVFFSYYGGKFSRSQYYPAPKHRLIIEPFCGSAGYSTRYHDHDVRLYDLDHRVIGTWKYLIRAKGSEIRSLPGDVRHLDDHPGLIQEAQWLIGWWLVKGLCQPHRKLSYWADFSPEKGKFWCPEIRDRIAEQVERIRHWKAEIRSYDTIPNETAVWFVDCPYSGRLGEYYTCQFRDHERLGSWCRGRAGQVIACEHRGATWLPFVSLGRTNPRDEREVFWTNA